MAPEEVQFLWLRIELTSTEWALSFTAFSAHDSGLTPHLAHKDSIIKNGGDKPPLPTRYPCLACGQLPIPILNAFKVYIGSAGSIPARQIDRDVVKLRSFYFYLSLVIMTGLLYYMDEVKIKWFNIDGKHCLLEWHP